MTSTSIPLDHPTVAYGKTGVLVVNLGTPDAPEPTAIHRYLKEFLSDKRVIELPSIIWQPILRCFVLTFRPKKLKHNYEMIWLKEQDQSPLAYYTKRQSEKLGVMFSNVYGDDVITDYAMCYGNPSIKHKLSYLAEQGAEKIIVVPMYPQYSATTTAAVCDKVFNVLKTMRRQPAISVTAPFHDRDAYINATARHYNTALNSQDVPEDAHILFSFHGLPERYFQKGDPYHCHCRKTARLLASKMGRKSDDHSVAFQSRFGKDAWLKPYAEPFVASLAKDKGVKHLVMCAPGFLADCLETLEEIAIGLKETFLEAGGENFYYLPCLNESDEATRMLYRITDPYVSAATKRD